MSEWTDERVARLRELAAEGLSASLIAKELGGVSRNAIIGKCIRFGIQLGRVKHEPHVALAAPEVAAMAKKPPAIRPPRKPQRVPTVRADCTEVETISFAGPVCEPVDDCEPDASGGVTLIQLMDDSCRWPIGDPATPTFRFCGVRTANMLANGPYCKHHARLAFD